ncbi:Potassium channel domain-containing protein [[Candida] zeylanoides]
MLSRIRTATSTGASPGIDYSQPKFDEDWSRSRQKLAPLLAHGVERPADATDISSAHMARHRQRLERRMSRHSSRQGSRQASPQASPRSSRPPSPSRSHTTQAPGPPPSHPQQPPERSSRSQWSQPTARSAWSQTSPTSPTSSASSAWSDQSERSGSDRGSSRRHSAASADSTGTNEARRRMVALKHILNVPISTLTTLAIKPGEPHFVLWFFISSYFPVITACIGPMANMISVIGLIQHWRVDAATGSNIPDTGVPFAFNILSLVLGMAGNISLLMNFSGRVRYLVTQSVSISCWAVACAVLVTALAITKVRFLSGPVELHPGHPVVLVPSEGYWYAVFTAGLYLVCCLILSVNFLGYRLRKYPPTFNLGPKQRSLMIFTIVFAVWLLAGALLFAHMIPDLSYGSSLYFCTVSVLTIGLGDILPRSPGAKVLVLSFSLVGVLIMGLIITMVRQVVLASGGPTIFWHQIERDRVKALRR